MRTYTTETCQRKTIETVKNEFLFHCKYEKGLSEKTIRAYNVDINQMITFWDSDNNAVLFEDISKDMLKTYLQHISKFKPKTIKRKIATMKAIFSYFEFENDKYINPLRKIRLNIKEPKVLPPVMCDNEIEMIICYFYRKRHEKSGLNKYSYMAKTRDAAIVELLFATGIRVSELCGLNNSDVDLNHGTIKVNGKGSKERIIQICSKEVISILKDYKRLAKPETYFFVNRLGNGISTQSVRLLIKKCITELKLQKHITPHTFRHTFATLLLERDVDIKYIQNLLGHSSIVTTQIYTHVNMAKQKQILQHKHPRNKITVSPIKASHK